MQYKQTNSKLVFKTMISIVYTIIHTKVIYFRLNNGTGRKLQPVNFSTEICHRFNLGPLHTLTGLIEDIVKQHDKHFFRKAPPKNLNASSLSSAIVTYRRKEEEKSQVPYLIFE